MKVLGPTTDFPTWRSSKGNENPQEIWFFRPVGFDYRTYTGLGKQTLGRAQTKPCVHQDPGERSSDPTRDWARLACEYPGISDGGVGQQVAYSEVRGTEYNSAGISPFEGLTQNNREGTQPCPSAENWIKDLLSMAPPIRTRPRLPQPVSPYGE